MPLPQLLDAGRDRGSEQEATLGDVALVTVLEQGVEPEGGGGRGGGGRGEGGGGGEGEGGGGGVRVGGRGDWRRML